MSWDVKEGESTEQPFYMYLNEKKYKKLYRRFRKCTRLNNEDSHIRAWSASTWLSNKKPIGRNGHLK